MKLILLILFCCVSVFSQTDTKTNEKPDTKIDKEAFTKNFAEKILKEAKWAKVITASSTDFYVDTTFLKRVKNSVIFYTKIDKRGNLMYTKLSGDCQSDFYLMKYSIQHDVGEELKMDIGLGYGTAKSGTAMFEMLNYACTEGAKIKEK
jgi:hypothetical protein